VLEQLVQMPPEQLEELVREGTLPPEVLDIITLLQQQAQQGGVPTGLPPGLPPPPMQGTPPPM
jgi:hypothetical protein